MRGGPGVTPSVIASLGERGHHCEALSPITRELVEGEDFYREGPYIVFTAKYLRDRGYCCESGCRHCPCGYRNDARNDASDEREPE